MPSSKSHFKKNGSLNHMYLLLRRLSALVFILMSFASTANIPGGLSKQQIDAFKSLPLSQQKALAKRYGVDPDKLQQGQRSTERQDYEQNYMLPRNNDEMETGEFDFDKKFEPKKNELKRYGLDLFAGQPTTFEQFSGAPVPADYVVGPGDSVNVVLYGKLNEQHSLEVGRDGTVVVPTLQPMVVAGMSFNEVKQALTSMIRNKMIGVNASVSMGELRSIRVFVLGEAYRPGAYSISSLSTITNALIASGGLSEIGSLRAIELKRAGKVIAELDMYDLLIRGDNRNDVVLQANDVVFIPAAGDLVSMTGEVRREAIYEMKDGENYQDLIRMAGGLTSTAYPSNSIVERFDGASLRTLISLDLSDAKQLKLAPLNGDKLTISAVSEQYKDAISLIGAVVRPGKLQWQKDIRIADVLKSVHGDLLNIADLEYALVVREKNSKGDIELMQFSPANAIEQKNPEDNLLLQRRDKIVIFSRFETFEAENRLLDKYAFTESEINERQQSRLWEQYQQQQFMDYVGAEADSGKSKEELNRQEFDNANKSLMDLTAEENINGGKEQDYSLFSRRRLLAPIILQLKEQSGLNSPVQLVEIDGKVKYPGVYPLVKNGRVSNLLTAAGGILESAFLQRAELTRLVSEQSSTNIKHLHLNLSKAVVERNSDDNVALQSKDRLNVLAIPNWQENITVKLYGEFKFPGDYTIRRGELLSSVIERAGGFTEFSSPKAAVFSRASLRQKERQHLNKLAEDLKRNIAAKSFQTGNGDGAMVSYGETKQLLADLSKVHAIGRLVIDLDKVIDKTGDVQLENGDVLYLPPLIQSINVIGEVNVSTAHMYDKEVSVKEYIQKSGGFKQRADEERVYIIKADGSVLIPQQNNWFAVEYDVPLESGDTIVVPLDAEHMDNLTLYSTTTQIIYQLGVAIAAISSL